MTSRLRLLVIADVGGEGTRHIGDEAMLEANLAAFRRLIPDVAFTVVSADPAWVASRYGVDAVARADGIVISGGGCLSSSWPHLLYERVALLQLARRFGKPAVVLGQTLGPRLREDERNLLADALSSARLVGLRELPSIALAFGMSVPPARLWYQADDAMLLSASADAGSDAAPALTIAVTIDPQLRAAGDRLFDAFARQLRDLSARTQATLVLIPHAFGQESHGALSDLTESRRLAERLDGTPVVIAERLDAAQARQMTGDAAMVISTRYHPIVFGLAAGTACIGIYADEYCRIKLQGALAHAKLERWTLTYEDVLGEKLPADALGLWEEDRGSFERLSERCHRAEIRASRLEGELTPANTIRRYAGSLLRRMGLGETTT